MVMIRPVRSGFSWLLVIRIPILVNFFISVLESVVHGLIRMDNDQFLFYFYIDDEV